MQKIYKFFLTLLLLAGFLVQAGFCALSDEFKAKLTTLKWVAYSPTNYDPTANVYPTEDSLRGDLQTLYDYGFRAIVTYGSKSTLAQIPRLAAETGFCGVIMGIWDLADIDEIMNAVAAGEYVDGYCVGNEGLNIRYDLDTLKKTIEEIKETTGRPATTTEEINDYYNVSLNLISVGDWIFPNIHPFLSRVRDPRKAVVWLGKHHQLLKKQAGVGRIIIFKEAGFPTQGASGATESNQREFFLNLEKTDIPFVYFEAFDQPWKTGSALEPHWGLFNQHRRPKKYIR